MRPLRYSINVTLDGCVDHRAGSTNEELHRFWAEKLARADALLFGRVTYEMMQAAWRWPANGLRPEWMAEWMEPFARTIDAAKKIVVHHVAGSSLPNWLGTEQVRHYGFSSDGRQLTLSLKNGDRITQTLTWERARQP